MVWDFFGYRDERGGDGSDAEDVEAVACEVVEEEESQEGGGDEEEEDGQVSLRL